MANFYKYSYLTAHDYLNKFREGLHMPNLNRALLTKLLKVYYHNHKNSIDCDFIVKDDYGNLALYNRDYLNRMLGVDKTGYKYQKDTIYLKELRDYLEDWEYEAARKDADVKNNEKEVVEDPMKLASDELIYNDNYNPDIDESRKSRKIYLTESQLVKIIESEAKQIKTSEQYDPRKVLIVKNFLDNNFVKCSSGATTDSGQPTLIPMVSRKTAVGVEEPIRDSQLFYYLQDKYVNIYSDSKKRDNFIKKVIVAWYYRRITPEGIILSRQFSV